MGRGSPTALPGLRGGTSPSCGVVWDRLPGPAPRASPAETQDDHEKANDRCRDAQHPPHAADEVREEHQGDARDGLRPAPLLPTVEDEAKADAADGERGEEKPLEAW